MKFGIREGFVVIQNSQRKLDNGQVENNERRFYPSDTVDFNEDEARLHAHKLIPQDKAATAFLESQQVQTSTQDVVPLDQVKSMIESAVQAAIAGQSAAASAAAAAAQGQP